MERDPRNSKPEAPPPPAVRLELPPQGGEPGTVIDFEQETILLGTVAGCDLRLPAADLPPLVCLLTAHPGGLRLRKLAPATLLLLNGQPVSEAALAANDELSIGRTKIIIRWKPPPVGRNPPGGLPSIGLLEEGIKKLALAQRQFEEAQRDWELDAERQAETLALRSRQLLEGEKKLAGGRAELDRERTALAAERKELDVQAASLADRARRQAEQEAAAQAEGLRLAEVRDRLRARYHRRRDHLLALRESVRSAGQKVQEQKQALAAEVAAWNLEKEALVRSREEIEAARKQLALDQSQLAAQHRLIEEWQDELEVDQRRQAQQAAELAAGQAELEKSRAQHREDLARLERFHATLAARQQQLDRKADQLDADASALAEHARQVEASDARLRQDQTELVQKQESIALKERELADRAAALELQQGQLAVLRGRVERLQAELFERERALTDQRLRQHQAEQEIIAAARDVHDQKQALRRDQERWHAERTQIEERCRTLEAEASQARGLLADLEQRSRAVEQLQAELEDKARRLAARAGRLLAYRQRLHQLRQTVRERAAAFAQGDETRESLQESLRQRAFALAEREQSLDKETRELQESAESLRLRLAEWEQRRQELEARQQQQQLEMEARQQALNDQASALDQERQRLAQEKSGLEAAAKELEDTRGEIERQRAILAAERTKTESECQGLRARLPELIQDAQAALARLSRARQQLRDHLAEVHQYADQCQADFEAAQAALGGQTEQLRRQSNLLARAQAEHRLAVGLFRQYLSEWQEQILTLKDSFAQGESRLDEERTQLQEQARRIDESASRLAERAEQLQDQERDVAERRAELNRHLRDMQQWYRGKLRELAERNLLSPAEAGAEADPAILPLRPPALAADQDLAGRLVRLGLVDQDALAAILEAAARQGRSLRDALLDHECLTPYQVELIEAGRLEALVLGPLRIIDRLRQTPLETVYRVFDPRRGAEALLRQLGDGSSRRQQDEFREGFARALEIQHPNLAGTWEVLERDGRPAVLQEWTAGVPSGEWSEFAAMPAIWIRLLTQAAAGLAAAHAAGVCHGHLHAGRLLLTEDGVLKLCGLGEPGWLHSASAPASDVAADLRALGEIAAGWLAAGTRFRLARKGIEPLQTLARRLRSGAIESADQLLGLLQDLSQPHLDDDQAWPRLLEYVRERLAPAEAASQRQSA